MDPSRSGARREVRKMEVGPSAPPMMPMEAASWRVKSMPGIRVESTRAPSSAPKIPSWAAAPRSAVLGLAMSGPKSVMAPTLMKISRGNSPVVIPML